MSKEPTIGKFLDSEEEELFRAIESDDYEFGRSILTPERKAELQQAARNTLNDEHIQNSSRHHLT
jgi:hypothetical protein